MKVTAKARAVLPYLVALFLLLAIPCNAATSSFTETLKAAEQGDAEAQNNLGRMYAKGQGVTQNDTEAVKWFRKAANQGFANAQNNLGVRYATGRGVTQDERKAIEWYRKAADQGYTMAQYNLGLMYATGRGVTQNYSEAYMWTSLAAAKGHEAAKSNLEAIKTHMTSKQIAKAQKRIAPWKPTSALQ